MTPPGRPVLFVNTRPRGGKAERVGWPSSPGNAASTCAPPHPEQDLATLVEAGSTAMRLRPPAYGDAKARTLLDSGSSSSTKRAQVSLRATHFEVTGPTPVDAGVDGEAVDLTPPLRFVIRHNALRVRVPSSRA
jgi:hypothetical protein